MINKEKFRKDIEDFEKDIKNNYIDRIKNWLITLNIRYNLIKSTNGSYISLTFVDNDIYLDGILIIDCNMLDIITTYDYLKESIIKTL